MCISRVMRLSFMLSLSLHVLNSDVDDDDLVDDDW